MQPGAVLDQRTLNRALLARQHLLARTAERTALQLVEDLVGLQAQNPRDPYVALWSRVAGFDPDAFSRAHEDKAVVRVVGHLRRTIHLTTPEDCLGLRPVLRDVCERSVDSQFRRQLDGLDPVALAAIARPLFEAEPRPMADVRKVLLERLPGRDGLAIGEAVASRLPLVQLPPRGLWRRSGKVVLTTAERWLGAPVPEHGDVGALVLRYLRAFGPASVADVRTWSGIAGLAAEVDRLRDRLVTYRDERGRELLDVPDGLFVDPDTPAPPRFLPEFDNVLLGHDDRTRVFGPELGGPVPYRTGYFRTFLVDGLVAGVWRPDPKAGTITLDPSPGVVVDDAVRAEARAVATFLDIEDPRVVVL